MTDLKNYHDDNNLMSYDVITHVVQLPLSVDHVYACVWTSWPKKKMPVLWPLARQCAVANVKMHFSDGLSWKYVALFLSVQR